MTEAPKTLSDPAPLGEVLPFVAWLPEGEGRDWWAVPPSPTYEEGAVVGAKMATAFLRLRAVEDADGGILQLIAIRMAELDMTELGLRGQVVGFWSAIDAAIPARAAPAFEHA